MDPEEQEGVPPKAPEPGGPQKQKTKQLAFTIGAVTLAGAAAVAVFVAATFGMSGGLDGAGSVSSAQQEGPVPAPSAPDSHTLVTESPAPPAVSAASSLPESSAPDSGASSAVSSVPAGGPVEQLSDPLLVLVNKDNPVPEDYTPNIISAYNSTFDAQLQEPFRQMYLAAEQEGAILWITSGYRTASEQEQAYQERLQRNLNSGMSEEEAQRVTDLRSSHGGYSEYETGLCIDVNGAVPDFDEMLAGQWMLEHSWEYGFILRYPEGKEEITGFSYQPFHYRYVGVEHARQMHELDLSLEEYVEYVRQYGPPVSSAAQ